MTDLLRRVRTFSNETNPTVCECEHKLIGTGAVFFQSVQLLKRTNCNGWQSIRKGIK